MRLGTDDAREEFIEEEDGIEKGHMVGHHYGSYFSCCSSSFAPDPMISATTHMITTTNKQASMNLAPASVFQLAEIRAPLL